MTENQFNKLQPEKLCPFNSNDWETMKNKRNCPDPEFYHCMPNQYNEPGEICVKPNWASKNYCPIFNTAANDIDLIPCDLQYGACSDTDYRSNQVFLYPGCLNKTLIIGKTSTDRTDSESAVLSPVKLQIIIPAVAIPLLLLLLIGVAFYCWRRKGTKLDANDIELQPLLHQNTVPWRFKKTINYLENKVFCRPESYEHAVGILSTKGHITLIGPPGSGKTFMAVQLARQLCGKEKTQMVFCKTLHEITALPKLENACLYVIMDGWLDQYMYYPSKVKEDKQLFDHIFDDCINYKTVRIIFTVQEDRWKAYGNRLSNQKMFWRESLFFINNKSFSNEVVQSMIIHHLQYHETREDSMRTKTKSDEENLTNEKRNKEKIIKQAIAEDLKRDKEFSLPLVIDLLCANNLLVPKRAKVTKHGFSKILQKFLQKWLTDESKDEKDSFTIFLFTALQGGKVTLHDFSSKVVRPTYENVCKEYKSECREDIESIEGLLRQNGRLMSCLYEENDVFVFRHDSLLCFVLQFLTETKNANFLIQNADLEILLNRCWIKDGIFKSYNNAIKDIIPSNPVGTVCLPIDAFMDLAVRINGEMERSCQTFPDWPKHVFMEHSTFLKTWNKVQPELNVAYPEKCPGKLPNVSLSISKNEETSFHGSKSPGIVLIQTEIEKNSLQIKIKDEEKAISDSDSKRTGYEEEIGQKGVKPVLENKYFSGPNKGESPENFSNPNTHAFEDGQSTHKTKKNKGKVISDKAKIKSDKQQKKREV
ncbi:uncharacterized protein LOC134248610 [Saccostrea cucullata]|uniref:uncharacterized protein LOC134248610 n=1 Tax=Saccostrea cuccullata TaxID=36930 RepID=UPI002ED5E5CC